MELETLTDEELVALWFHANAVLHRRGAKLWHAGDLAEILVTAAIGGERAKSNVQRGYDVIGPDQRRWQVKALVNRPGNTRTSVGFLRQETYDVLAIVLFGEDMTSVQAWQMPPEVVPDYGRWHPERNQYRLTRTQKLVFDVPLPVPNVYAERFRKSQPKMAEDAGRLEERKTPIVQEMVARVPADGRWYLATICYSQGEASGIASHVSRGGYARGVHVAWGLIPNLNTRGMNREHAVLLKKTPTGRRGPKVLGG